MNFTRRNLKMREYVSLKTEVNKVVVEFVDGEIIKFDSMEKFKEYLKEND